MASSRFKDIRYTNRWFCYIDLLGFAQLVNSSNISRVITTYGEVLDDIEGLAGTKKKGGVYYSWFSDTFIIYSRGASETDFSRVEQVGRLFFQKLIRKNIPARGALTFGKLYSQLARNIFVGPALIDAYRYGECQNWIGFILTPNACNELEGSEIDASKRPHYRKVENPDIIRRMPADNIYAFAFNNGLVNGQNPYIKHISEMRMQSASKYHHKYDNTEEFLRLHNPNV